jgi:hypothetical protein
LAKLTQPDVMERNLRMSYDESYYQHLRHLVRFQLGQKYQAPTSGLSPSLTGIIPDDVDIIPVYSEPGQSRRILTNSALMAQKVCHVTPDPEYPDKPRAKEMVTRAFNKALWKGRPHLGPTKFEEFGDWGTECEHMFPYGDGLGVGFVQIGVRDGWTSIQAHPTGRVIWDRHRLGVARTRYIAFVHLLSEEEAVAQFGSDIRKEISESSWEESGASHALRTVRCLQYFDMGLGEHDPTEMWRLNALGGKVLDVSENKYGCLPFAHMQYLHLPGMRRPMGRIEFQVADQQMRNGIERYMRLALERGPGFDMIDPTGVDKEDLEALDDGELIPLVRKTLPPMGKMADQFQRVPAQESPLTAYKILEYLDRMDPGNSGISEADRANVTSSARTLGEIELTQGGADTQKAWSQRQYALFLSRLFYKANYIAAQHHKAPTPIALNGVPLPLNDPNVMQSNLQYWLTPQSWPEINEDNLLKADPVRKMQIAQGKWLALADSPILGPLMNPVEVLRALLTDGYGEKDADRFLNPQAVAMLAGAQPGVGMGAPSPMLPMEGLPGMQAA